MVLCALLCVLGSLLSVEAITPTLLSVEEGKTVKLKCVFPRSDGSAMQWLTPRGYVAFFNTERVLKDKRFQSIKSSRNRLIIHILNVTREDEGIYTCYQYSQPMKIKLINVTVWAAPSKPIIDVTHVSGRYFKNEMLLNCSTSGGKPNPKITWLLGHTEVSGNNKVTFEGTGKKSTLSSTLRVKSFTCRSTVSCIVRHRSLSSGNYSTTFHFSSLYAVTEFQDLLRNHQMTEPLQSTEVPSSMTFPENTGTQKNGGAVTNRDEQNITTEVAHSTVSPESSTATRNGVAATKRVEENGNTEVARSTVFLGSSTAVRNGVTATKKVDENANTDSEASKLKSNRTTILVLVSLMIGILLVIVHLFFIKLRKAHSTWKKENENSDQTLESNKSRSNNDDVSGQARSGHAPSQNSTAIQYNTQVSL
ncbi:cytotoxic and regulatory T-cell molecule-like isoform X2 [Hyperolius riggenbachi]|uniref:cytotoxic and regulatory T-cell molecule-like isoform X2 n=1 Tax=Hyperolius riggenbachi TaxID=752182 RepID=UPI0035A295A2